VGSGAWAKYMAGDEKASGAIVGRVMKASQGKACSGLPSRHSTFEASLKNLV
jgi:Asp-tRNA(Asn)/Glu-tRNA(Gln) amidotransferase B subunit